MKTLTKTPSPAVPKKVDKTRKSSRDKKKQLSLTNQWLEENYCVCDGVCIPRCILYSHYLDFCQLHGLLPACAATFGKIIRQKFPNITTRRLGTRGHSKYHYYGICIKESSQYYQALYSGGGLTRFSGSKFVSEGGFTRKYNLASRIGTLLPDFPSCYGLNLPPTVNPTKLETLLVMYKTHCQCILDTVISARYIEVPTYLMHFWQRVPEHLMSLFDNEVVITLLTYCDTILYNTLTDVLIPATMQEVSEELLVDIQKLASSWESWTSHSLAGLPLSLVTSRLAAAQRFMQALRRQANFLHLAQMVRPILYDCQLVNQISTDVNSVQIEARSVIDGVHGTSDLHLEADLLGQLKEVLHKQATVEAFTEWLDATLNQRVLKQCDNNSKLFRKKVHSFLVTWSKFGVELMQALNLQKATSLASVNLLKLLLDEYIMVAVDSQVHEHATHELLAEIQQLAVVSNSTDANVRDIPAPNYNGYVFHTFVQENLTQFSIDTRQPTAMYTQSQGMWDVHGRLPSSDIILTPPRSPPCQQNSCRYNHTDQQWTTTGPAPYDWSHAYATGSSHGSASFSAMMTSATLPCSYEMTRRKDIFPSCSLDYKPITYSESQFRESGYTPAVGNNFTTVEHVNSQNLPSIGHVLF